MKHIPRGLRNNNPGNLKAGIEWEGLAHPADMTPEQRKETTFCVFRGPWWGFRAMAKILQTYYHRHNLKTVREVLNRYAPNTENHTINYVRFVCDQINAEPGEALDLDDYDTLRGLMRAMTTFENGAFPYTWEIDAGLLMAGIEPDGYDLAA